MRSIILPIVLALAACGDKPASKSSNSGTNNEANNTATNNVVANNSASCIGGLCPGDCFEDGWCVAESHLAFYIGMWAEAADRIWLADQSGMVRVGSGTSWSEHPVVGINQINDIRGDGQGNIWVSTYPSGVYRFDGSGWVAEVLDPPPADGMGRLAHDTVTNTMFVEAGDGVLYERQGERWVRFADAYVGYGGLTDVANCGGQRYFSLGAPTLIEDGRVTTLGIRDNANIEQGIRLADGTPMFAGNSVVAYNDRWETITEGPLSGADSVAATSRDDIWVLQGSEELWHFDGREWTLVRTFPFNGGSSPSRSVFTDTPGQVLLIDKNGRTHVLDAAGNETDLILPPSSATTLGDHLTYQVSSDELWVATPSVARWTSATGWQSMGSVPYNATMFVVENETSIWAVDEDGAVNHWDGDRRRELDTGLSVPVTDVAVSDTGMVWVVGPTGVAQFDGVSWTTHPDFDGGADPGNTADVSVVASGDEVWILRRDQGFHWDGSAWEVTLPQRRTARLGCDGNELVALGHQPPALLRGRLDAMELASDEAGDENYSTFGAWMTTPDDVWVTVQAQPPMQHLQGTQWSPSLLDLGLGPKHIQQIPSGHVFALTDRALLVRAP